MKYKTAAIKPEHMHQTGNRWTLSRIHSAFFLLLVSYKAAGLLWMRTENCDVVHNYMCWCVQHMPDCALVCVWEREREKEWECAHWCSLVSLCVYHVIAYTSTEATKEIHCQQQHSYWQGAIPPQRLWDRVYNQMKCGRVKSVRVTLCYVLYSVQLFP